MTQRETLAVPVWGFKQAELKEWPADLAVQPLDETADAAPAHPIIVHERAMEDFTLWALTHPLSDGRDPDAVLMTTEGDPDALTGTVSFDAVMAEGDWSLLRKLAGTPNFFLIRGLVADLPRSWLDQFVTRLENIGPDDLPTDFREEARAYFAEVGGRAAFDEALGDRLRRHRRTQGLPEAWVAAALEVVGWSLDPAEDATTAAATEVALSPGVGVRIATISRAALRAAREFSAHAAQAGEQFGALAGRLLAVADGWKTATAGGALGVAPPGPVRGMAMGDGGSVRDEPSFLDLARAQIVLDLTSDTIDKYKIALDGATGTLIVSDVGEGGDKVAAYRLEARAGERLIGAAPSDDAGIARLALADLAAQDRDDDSALSLLIVPLP